MNSEGNPNKKITETIVGFWNKHRKGILTVTSIIGAIGTVVLGAKCYWDATASERWFENASLDELKAKRNDIHSEYMQHTINDEYRLSLSSLLPKFDRRISELQWGGKTPTAPSYPREHGHNLYKPD